MIKNNTDSQLTAFIHKNTPHKVEVACIMANDINWKNIERLYRNMDKLRKPAQEFIDYINSKYSYMRFTYEKGHSGKESEWRHQYIWHKDRVMLWRAYKMVWPYWYKIEITVPVSDWNYTEAIDDGLEVLRKCRKGLKKSEKPYYMQNWSDFIPLEYAKL